MKTMWICILKPCRTGAPIKTLKKQIPITNFGNVLSGWLASRMGLPVDSFVVATNHNDILHRFFSTGEYDAGEVNPSLAPSMDIQAASNFERFLYYQNGEDGKKTATQMAKIAKTGKLKVPNFDPGIFKTTRCDDKEIIANIQMVKEYYNYVVDPHTACAFQEIDPDRSTVILNTASPAKFPAVIKKAIGETPTDPLLDVLKKRSQKRYPLDANAGAVREFIEANSA